MSRKLLLVLVLPVSVVILVVLCIYRIDFDSTPDPVPYLSTAIIFRHGQRTPILPVANTTCALCHDLGFGQLTKVGSRQMYDQGVLLRSKYSQLFPKDGLYRVKDMRIITSAKPRTTMSLQSFMAGFFPSHSSGKNNFPLGWQPIAFDMDYDGTIVQVRLDSKSCPKYFEGFYQCINEPPYSTMMVNDRDLLQSLPQLFNIQLNTSMDLLTLIDSIGVQIELYRDTTPHWIIDLYERRLSPYIQMCIHCLNYNAAMTRYRVGVVMTEIVENMKDIVEGKENSKRFQIYSGHDFNLHSIAYALGAKDQLPERVGHGDTIMVDLIANKSESEEPSVQVVYFSVRNGSVSQYPLIITGCDSEASCSLSAFIKATSYVNNATVKELESYCLN